jgi:hypothetical protein
MEPRFLRKIKLTRDRWALVDDEDYARISRHKWYCTNNGYAARGATRNGKHVIILMHRQIMRALPWMEVDHRNTVRTLDNRKSNLRLCRKHQNYCNRGKYKSGVTSKFKGVCWSKVAGKWSAQITVNYKKKHLGYFDDPYQAAEAYDQAALRHHGEFARTNRMLALLTTEV